MVGPVSPAVGHLAEGGVEIWGGETRTQNNYHAAKLKGLQSLAHNSGDSDSCGRRLHAVHVHKLHVVHVVIGASMPTRAALLCYSKCSEGCCGCWLGFVPADRHPGFPFLFPK